MINDFLKHYDYALCYAKSLCKGDKELAEDLTQNVFLSLCSKNITFGNEDDIKKNYKGYLYCAIKNKYITEYRRVRKLPKMVYVSSEQYQIQDNPTSKNIISDKMKYLLHELSIDIRLPFVLDALYDYTYTEIASILDVPEGTVKSRIFTAKEKMRKIIESNNLKTLK